MFRIIVEDYETRLEPVVEDDPVSQEARGKVEWERYRDGHEEFDLKLRKLRLPDGTLLDVHLVSGPVGRIKLKWGLGRLVIDSRRGEEVPRVRNGDRVVVSLDGKPLLAGTFVPD